MKWIWEASRPKHPEDYAASYPFIGYYIRWHEWEVEEMPSFCFKSDNQRIMAYGPFQFLEFLRENMTCEVTPCGGCDAYNMWNVREYHAKMPLLMNVPNSTCISEELAALAIPLQPSFIPTFFFFTFCFLVAIPCCAGFCAICEGFCIRYEEFRRAQYSQIRNKNPQGV